MNKIFEISFSNEWPVYVIAKNVTEAIQKLKENIKNVKDEDIVNIKCYISGHLIL